MSFAAMHMHNKLSQVKNNAHLGPVSSQVTQIKNFVTGYTPAAALSAMNTGTEMMQIAKLEGEISDLYRKIQDLEEGTPQHDQAHKELCSMINKANGLIKNVRRAKMNLRK